MLGDGTWINVGGNQPVKVRPSHLFLLIPADEMIRVEVSPILRATQTTHTRYVFKEFSRSLLTFSSRTATVDNLFGVFVSFSFAERSILTMG